MKVRIRHKERENYRFCLKTIGYRWGLFFGIILLSFSNSFSQIGRQKNPNVIFIMADDLGYNDVGFLNPKTFNLTPTLDSLAAESMVFTNFYAMPTCSPSRSSLMTGLYPGKHGIYAVDGFSRTPETMRKVLGGESKKSVDAGTWLMPSLFKKAGYTTALIGKWHLGQEVLSFKGQPIFDEIRGMAHGPNEGSITSYFPPYGSNISFPQDFAAPEYITDRLTYEAVRQIRQAQHKPFFLYLAHYAPHVPLQAKAEDSAMFKDRKPFKLQNRKVYGAMVYAVDRSVKTILAELRKLDLLDDTIIVFLSDNGAQIMSSDNFPLKGQKGEIHEGGVKVPCFIWGKNISAGRENKLGSIVDLLPTLAHLTNQQLPRTIDFDGIDLFSNSINWADRQIFFHNPGYIGNGSSNAMVWQPPASVIHQGDWKLVQSLEDEQVELYDLKHDVGENNDVSEAHPEIKNRLLAELKNWQISNGVILPTKINLNYGEKSRNWTKDKDTRMSKAHVDILIK